MPGTMSVLRSLGCALLVLIMAAPAAAQIEDQLSAYTGDNATGFLQPLADSFGANLNDGWFHSGKVPAFGPHFAFEVRVMSVKFGSDDETFQAVTEGFVTETTVEAPTIIGPTDAVVATDPVTNAQFILPGGLDLSSFSLAVPQIRIGAFAGTEAIIRYFAIDTGDSEIGDISLFGIGGRHSVSQYLSPLFPVDIAVGFMWQNFKVGENSGGDELLSTDALSIGVQASKAMGPIQPYAGFGFDSYSMDVQYDADAGGAENLIDLEFESSSTAHLTLGAALDLWLFNINGEYNVADQNSFSVGLALGN